jgi:thiamine biosynthesis lipoprotein
VTAGGGPGGYATALPAFHGLTPLVEHPRQAFVEQIMGLPISVHVRGPQARTPKVAALVARMYAALRADDERFSTWKPGSAVCRIQRGELRLSDAEPRVRAVAALCEQAGQRTGGAFSAWLPGPGGVPRFDPTGLVKGWAVEQAFERLMEQLGRLGAHDALVLAGGDVAVACLRTDTPDWVIGIEDPQDRRRVLLRVPLRCGAVATSGTAARGHHILDPATGEAATGLLSASIISASLTWADVDATAAFVRGPEAAAWVATLPGRAAVLVGRDGIVRTGPWTLTDQDHDRQHGRDGLPVEG